MRLVILGATGGIGRFLVSGALDQGHEVTAFARAPEKITIQHPRLRLIGGDLFNAGQMTAALEGSQAVVSAFGPVTLARTDQRRDFGRVLTQSVRHAGVTRVLHVSSALLFPDTGMLGAVLRNTIFRNVVADSANAEAELMQPDLAWTIVRPPRLLNTKPTGHPRSEAGKLPKGGGTIARADVATFMLQEVAAPRYIHQIAGVAT